MTKKAKIVLAVILLVFLIVVGAIAHAIAGTAKIQETNFTVEYGKKVHITSMDIFGKDVDAKINVSSITNEEGKDYPGIGEYVGSVTYHGMKSNITVNVTDTKKPKWVKAPSKVELGLFEGVHDFKEDFKAKDVSEIKYSFETADIRFDINGTYHAVAKATDASGNVAKKKFTVVIGTGGEEATENSTDGYYDQYGNYIVGTQDSSTKQSKKSKKTDSASSSSTTDGYYDQNGNDVTDSQDTSSSKKKAKKTKKSSDATTQQAQTSTPSTTTSGGYYDQYGNYYDQYGNYYPAQPAAQTTAGASYGGNGTAAGYDAYAGGYANLYQ